MLAGAATAQTRDVPYWVSIVPDKVHMRTGPGTSYPISWIYTRAGLPLKVLRVSGGWRLVEDPDGDRGWIMSRFLSRERVAIVIGQDLVEMRSGERGLGSLAWRLEPGVTGSLGDCEDGWCAFAVGKRKGFAPQESLWGAGAP